MLTRLTLLVVVFFTCTLFAQQKPDQSSTTCTFADGNQVTIRYPQLAYNKTTRLPEGKPWPPESTPIYLFSQSDLILGQTTIPAGAYSVYTVSGKKDSWDLVVSRDVSKDGHYDASKDLGRVAMQTGSLDDSTSHLTAYFGHTAPKTCALRVDYGKERGYTDFKEK